MKTHETRFKHNTIESLRNNFRAKLPNILGDNLLDSLNNAIWYSLHKSLEDQLNTSIKLRNSFVLKRTIDE